jgi:hypothetical protein
VDKGSGNLIVQNRIDYEALEQKRITFDLLVYDAGVPQKSAQALVVANIVNLNDEVPKFDVSIKYCRLLAFECCFPIKKDYLLSTISFINVSSNSFPATKV